MSENQPPHGDARADQLLLCKSVEISAERGAEILRSLEGIPIDTDITLEAVPKTAPTAEELAEYEALRSVYEQARGVLRYDGVDTAKAIAYRDGLIDAIEVVKQIDGGTWEPTPADGPPTESILIDGVTYTVPAPVAAELLRLHLELKEGEEPVAAQNRFRGQRWGECTVDHARAQMANPGLGGNSPEYEVRLLYTRPHVPAPPSPPVNIFAELERITKAHIIEIENLLASRF